MPDILIRGITKPTDCGKCFVGDRTMCADGCHLHELPEHGDLIDRDVLKHKFCAHCDGYENDTGACVDGDQDCMDAKIIMTAPVIVPASKEESE